MADLATIEDIEARLGRPVDVDEHVQFTALLADASAAVRLYTGQTITEETSTWRTKARGCLLRLPQQPTTAVESVTRVSSATPIAFTWNGLQEVSIGTNFDGFERDIIGPAVVDVDYTHGWSTVPDLVVTIVCQACIRTFGAPLEDAAVSAEALGSYSESRSVTMQEVTSGGAVALVDAERQMLDKFFAPASPVRSAW